jgi:hypothetical protein
MLNDAARRNQASAKPNTNHGFSSKGVAVANVSPGDQNALNSLAKTGEGGYVNLGGQMNYMAPGGAMKPAPAPASVPNIPKISQAAQAAPHRAADPAQQPADPSTGFLNLPRPASTAQSTTPRSGGFLDDQGRFRSFSGGAQAIAPVDPGDTNMINSLAKSGEGGFMNMGGQMKYMAPGGKIQDAKQDAKGFWQAV